MDIHFARHTYFPEMIYWINATPIEIKQDLSQPIDMKQFPLPNSGSSFEVVAFCFMAIAQICKSGYDGYTAFKQKEDVIF